MGMRLKVRVEGNSMFPTLADGEVVVVQPSCSIIDGDVVLAEHPFKKLRIIKRASVSGSKVTLIGDNPAESSDSRMFGDVGMDSIVGKVVARLR
jgi:nickel-type superoxide dismutase maturation protease